MKNERIPALDGIRGAAIALILFYHLIICTIAAPGGTFSGYFWKIFRHSYAGVDLFFVLSGFLITRILLMTAGEENWLGRFWLRRLYRIIPLYLLFLIIGLAGFYLLGKPVKGAFALPQQVWPYFLMVQNFQMSAVNDLGPWGVTWSLAVEEQFYLLFPFIFFFKDVKKNKLIPIICLSSMAIAYWLRLRGEYLYSFVLLPYRMDSLSAGVLVAWVVHNQKILSNLKKIKYITSIILSISLMACILITIRDGQRNPFDHTIFALTFASLILHVILNTYGKISQALSIPSICRLGNIS